VTSLNLELEISRAGRSGVAGDYLRGLPAARAFFDGWWGDPAAYAAKAEEVRGRFDRGAREKLARAFRPKSAEQEARLRAWVDRDGFVVTTGQQPVLFTGPLYTIYKALTAVRLAEQLERTLGAPVLPVFWIASEDHDWEESSHTYVVGLQNDLRRIEVAPPAGGVGHALHRIRLQEELATAVDWLAAELPQTDLAASVKSLVARTYASGRTLPEAFRDTLEELLAPFGVFFIDAADPVVKEASAPLFAREIDRAEEHERVLADRARSLEASGYSVQVPILPGGLNLFLEGPAGRERLYRDGEGFQLRQSGERLTREQLLARAEADPLALSPNVLLRPVVESAALPTLSLVVGPGEGAYFAELQPYFGALGIRPPVAHPRFACTVVEGKIRKVIEKFEVPLEDLKRPFHETAAALMRETLPTDLQETLSEIRHAIERGTEDASAPAARIHPTLASSLQKARSASLDAWSDAERKILQALRRENETGLAQLEKARLHLFPEGAPQERMLNVFYYLARYGPEFLSEVFAAMQNPIASAGIPADSSGLEADLRAETAVG
jgi:bacillithiol synthase